MSSMLGWIIGWIIANTPILIWLISDIRLWTLGVTYPIIWMWVIGIPMWIYGNYLILRSP